MNNNTSKTDHRKGKKTRLRLSARRKKLGWNKGKKRIIDGSKVCFVRTKDLHTNRGGNSSSSQQKPNIKELIETIDCNSRSPSSEERFSSKTFTILQPAIVDNSESGCSFWQDISTSTPKKKLPTSIETHDNSNFTDDLILSTVSDNDDCLDGIRPLSLSPEKENLTMFDPTQNNDISIKPPGVLITGRRLFDVAYLFEEIARISQHSRQFDFSFANMNFIREERKGMHNVYHFKCNMCGIIEKLHSEKPSEENSQMNSNMAWVNSMLLTGQSYSQLKVITSTLDMPCMAKETFNKCQKNLSSVIHDVAWQRMEAAAKEEGRLAIEVGDVDIDGVPLVTVVTDGAWCKRTFGSNYDALSGVACIVGKRTQKVLFVNVRNSYCCICARARAKNDSPNKHICYKNWNKSPNSMESDIIVEGFKNSVAMHNLKYHQLIGDGYSSVMRNLLKAQPYGPGFTITKIECSNHILRNYLKRLRYISSKSKNDVGSISPILRKAITDRQMRLRCAVTGAMKYRGSQCGIPFHRRIEELIQDIDNGPCHVFGDHAKRAERGYFCDGPKENEENLVPVFQSAGVWVEIIAAKNLVAHHAASLLQNVTTNKAESFNSLVCKYVSGKRVNFSLRGGYQTKSELSVISLNTGGKEQDYIHKGATNVSPGHFTKVHLEQKERSAQKRKLRRLENTAPSKRRKLYSSGPDSDYGSVQAKPDMDSELFTKSKEDFLDGLSLTKEQRELLHLSTTAQVNSVQWRAERSKRLTASSFGKICKMRKNTKCANTVRTLLYSDFFGSKATRYGLEKEPMALEQLEAELNVKVIRSGLFVDEDCPWLGATPDGLIGTDGIVEVKCPAVAATMTPEQAIKGNKVTFCTVQEGEMHLKEQNNFMYQVQGQLHVTQRQYCLFVFWTPCGMLVENFFRNDHFWQEKMVDKLKHFFMNCLLPELVDPRFPRNLEIREHTIQVA